MNTGKIDWSDVQAARALLRRYFPPTRLVAARSLSKTPGTQVYLKLESELPTGAFKLRGAIYALHSEMARRPITEVIASSTGNHGAGVAYAAKLLGVRAKIFLPVGANPAKQKRIRESGAEIVECGKDISDAADAATAYAARSNAFFLNDATNGDVPPATATIAVEIIEQLPEAAEIWAPVGDSALIRGVAFAAKQLRPGIRIVGVQAERAPSYYLSWKRGAVVMTETCDTIADGLATRTPFEENVRVIRALVDDMRLVTEEQMLSAIEHLLTNENIVAEPAGAATTAAWLSSSPATSARHIALLLTGGNIAEAVLQAAVGDKVNLGARNG